MKLQDLKNTVESLSGIGPAAARQFARLGIFTIADLLQVFPRDYEDRTKKVSLAEFSVYPKVHTICKVTAHEWFGYGRMKNLKIAINDGTAAAWLIAFNRPFLQKSLPEGSIISVTGKFEIKYGQLQSSSFEAEKIAEEGELAEYRDVTVPDSKVLPIYPLTEGLSQKNYRKAITQSLRQYVKALENDLPDHTIKERHLLTKSQAIQKIHAPETLQDALKARQTLIYEELYNFEYKMALRALSHRGKLPDDTENSYFENNGAAYFSTPDKKTDFEKTLSPLQLELYKRLPFELTADQMKVIQQMNEDIDKSAADRNALINTPEKLTDTPFSMQRLLQGDVGSGKTLTAFFICVRVINYGGQCAFLAPTELLARQHAENAAKLLEPLGIKVAFLTGNLKSKSRQPLLAALKEGNINLIIGTHALFSKGVEYKNLHLAVIDEQHRFGVAQRESIIDRGRISNGTKTHTPDVLMMSATPIPQTLALTVFGDLDISIIKTMPDGRKPVKTYLTVMGHENNVYEEVRKQLKQGHQAYFVYPRISEDDSENPVDDKNLKSASEMFSFLNTQVYPEYTCALIHGKVDEDEQKQILDDFKTGKIQVLIATTVVEVGVDVANATCIVIEHADRFGLAELHQLRGRVGRSDLQSFCFLIYGKNISQDGIKRMKVLHETNDGFKIAEEDLKIRGPGEVTGTVQSGYLTLGIADLNRDKEILKIARYDALSNIRAEL